MKTLSVRQPWAWLIVSGIKLVENQPQIHRHRGELAIHAALKRDREPAASIAQRFGVSIPDNLDRGGIVGVVTVTDAVEGDQELPEQYARWRNTSYRFGLLLANARQVAFVPYRGQLSLFEVPDELIGPPLCQD
jgi:hypothetical protein